MDNNVSIPIEVRQIVAEFCRCYGPLNIVAMILKGPRDCGVSLIEAERRRVESLKALENRSSPEHQNVIGRAKKGRMSQRAY
jgi:hypothetical protein